MSEPAKPLQDTQGVGVGNARFRLGNYKGFVDTITFCCYWRWVFDKIGRFDEELVRNQDDELNLRVLLAGGKIYMDSDIRSCYYARGSLGKLVRPRWSHFRLPVSRGLRCVGAAWAKLVARRPGRACRGRRC